MPCSKLKISQTKERNIVKQVCFMLVYCHVVCWKSSDVSLELVSSIFRIKEEGKQESTMKQLTNIVLCVSCWFVAWFIFRP
jgi:hypothetical protein